MEDLETSINQYKDQLSVVNQALQATQDAGERESLSALQSELLELISLTQESLDTQRTSAKGIQSKSPDTDKGNELEDEYALFMKEMAASGAYKDKSSSQDKSDSNIQVENGDSSDIEDELASLLGMKCAVYHTHTWGGQPSLHNAMVSSVVPHQENDQFSDLQVCVLFTHPTHAEMLPCPFFLNGECKFSDEQCRYSHGTIVQLSNLKEAIEPNYACLKVGSRVLFKLKPPDEEDMTTVKKSTEKYHLWHRAIIKSIDLEKRSCAVKLEQNINTGDKRKSAADEYHVLFEEIFPLSTDSSEDTDSEDSLSDTEYPEIKIIRTGEESRELVIEKSLQTNAPAMGEWERHTRGMGSRIMLSMGYVPGTGLGAASDGRLRPVEARATPPGRSLDHCMALSEQDPLKVEQKLKRLQKKGEERNKRAYEREKEREKRNVFNFLNNTLGGKQEKTEQTTKVPFFDIKQSTSKDLNIEQFKLEEDCRKIENEILKLNNTLSKYPQGTNGHRSIAMQVTEKNKELQTLRNKEKQIAKEQKQRKDKHKMTVF